MAISLSGKVAVITGGASGIGLATCEALLEDGLKAIGVVDRSDAVVQVCKDLNWRAGRELAVPFEGDVTDADFRRRVFAELTRRFGPVHLCVPAAGITRDRLSVKVDRASNEAEIYPIEDFRAVLNINLVAPIYWAMESIATVAQDRARQSLGQWQPEETIQGSVVLIGSVSSTGNKGQISYATAKAGLEGAQATLAMEAVYHGVRCSIIHPGYTDTPMVRALGEETIREHILPHTQLRRLLRPEEVADGIRFLLRSPAASGSLWIDAGWYPAA